MKDIIVLVGFSNAGKDSILNELVYECGCHRVVSHTSRPIRKHEQDGREYHFISKEEFLELKDEFIETREYHTLVDNIPDIWYYGLHPDMFDDTMTNVVILDMLGYREIKKHFGDRVLSFFINCNEDTRRARCILRGDYNEPEFNRRLEDDKKQFPMEVIEKEIDEIIESTDVTENANMIISTLEKYIIYDL